MLKENLQSYHDDLQRGDILFIQSMSFIIMDISAFTSNGERYALVGLTGQFAGDICQVFSKASLSINTGVDIVWFKNNITYFSFINISNIDTNDIYIKKSPPPKGLIL